MTMTNLRNIDGADNFNSVRAIIRHEQAPLRTQLGKRFGYESGLQTQYGVTKGMVTRVPANTVCGVTKGMVTRVPSNTVCGVNFFILDSIRPRL